MNRVYRNSVLLVLMTLLVQIEDVHSQGYNLTKDGCYAFFENNPKTLGAEFGIGIPDKWTIQDLELPSIIAEMHYNQEIELFISIEAGDTFISREQARVIVNSEDIDRKIIEEHESQGFGAILIDATSEIVDSYPTRKLTFSIQRDDFIDNCVVTNHYIGELWFIFYEDVQINIMAFCPKNKYKMYSLIFRNIVKSIFFLN